MASFAQSTAMNSAASSSTTDVVAFDRDELVQRCLGSLALVERLLSRFDERFPIEVAQIDDSLSAGDTTTAARLAHRLKGAAANISAPALRNVLQQIEDSARADRMDQIASRMAELNRQWQRFGADKSASSTTAAQKADSPATQSI